MNIIYVTKIKKLKGHNYKVVYDQAINIYKKIVKKTKRRPYMRSKYFKKEKVFLDYFWPHIREKSYNDRVRRLKLYPCALDLIAQTNLAPLSKIDPNKSSERLHKFFGITKSNNTFYVQIKELKSGEKVFISVFPE